MAKILIIKDCCDCSHFTQKWVAFYCQHPNFRELVNLKETEYFEIPHWCPLDNAEGGE